VITPIIARPTKDGRGQVHIKRTGVVQFATNSKDGIIYASTTAEGSLQSKQSTRLGRWRVGC